MDPSADERAHTPHVTTIGISVTFIILVTIVVIARMYTRFRIHQHFWWDDWTMLVGAAGTLGMCVLDLILMRHGGGFAIVDVPENELRVFIKVFNIYQIVARISILFVKLSILLLYIRIFFPVGVGRKGTFWWMTQVVIWVNVLYTASLVLALSLQCVPFGLPWGTSCMNQWLVIALNSVINIISDVAVMIIPVASIWKLQMSRNKKWAVVSLFAFGTLAPLASVARLVYWVVTVDSEDKTVVYLIVGILANAEQVVGIIVGCLPTMSPWAIRIKGRLGAARNGLHARSREFNQNWDSLGGRKVRRTRLYTGGRDPYQVTDFTNRMSQEILYASPGNEQANRQIIMETLSTKA